MDGHSSDATRRPALSRWWGIHVSGSVDHGAVIARVAEDGGWSPRYAFMLMMSAGIAVLGLLLSSPAVVIGAMLISPLMGPIMALGFSLALFDFAAMRRALVALALGALIAVAFTALIVLCSPLKAATSEILARTRPNLFDLVVALFSALAGAFALIRGRGETIVGVAIATALMPPLATVGFGLATGSMGIAGGAFALFLTNFVTIALSSTIMARLYGFASHLSERQGWMQNALLIGVFGVMAVPLGISLSHIAREALVVTQVRGLLADRFGNRARVTQLDIDFDTDPIAIRTVVIAPRSRAIRPSELAQAIEARLGQPVTLQADQVLLDPGTGALDQERAALAQSQAQADLREEGGQVARSLALAAGIDPQAVMVDRDARHAVAAARPLPGATLGAYRALEQRAAAQSGGWTVELVPPAGLDLPPIRFADEADTLDVGARAAVDLSAWAARRWNWPALAVPGLTATPGDHPALSERRAAAIAAELGRQGLATTPASGTAASEAITLRPATE